MLELKDLQDLNTTIKILMVILIRSSVAFITNDQLYQPNKYLLLIKIEHKQKQPFAVLLQIRCLKKSQYSQENTVLESLFNKVVGLLSLKEDYCEYCDIFKNSIFKEHFWWLFLTKMINANSFKFLMPPPPAPPQKKTTTTKEGMV